MLNLDSYLNERRKPSERPVMLQQWSHLTFAHVRIDAQIVQSLLPSGLEVDTWEGETFLGFVPFFMRGVRPHPLPRSLSYPTFLETNIRTYVHYNGKPGVWFFSLDASDYMGCRIARSAFALPYFHSRMSLKVGPDAWESQGELTGRKMPEVWPRLDSDRPKGSYASRTVLSRFGEEVTADPGSLEFFLAERYTLFSCNRAGRLFSGRVWHEPYRVRVASDPSIALDSDASQLMRAMAPHPFADALNGAKWDHAMICDGVDVSVWPISTL